jgi:DNA-binding MarR family transcriptional regulator
MITSPAFVLPDLLQAPHDDRIAWRFRALPAYNVALQRGKERVRALRADSNLPRLLWVLDHLAQEHNRESPSRAELARWLGLAERSISRLKARAVSDGLLEWLPEIDHAGTLMGHRYRVTDKGRELAARSNPVGCAKCGPLGVTAHPHVPSKNKNMFSVPVSALAVTPKVRGLKRARKRKPSTALRWTPQKHRRYIEAVQMDGVHQVGQTNKHGQRMGREPRGSGE